MQNETKHVIISLGGSLIVPGAIDTEFLNSFRSLILEYVDKHYRFTLFTGGGQICREYINAAHSVRDVSMEERDWIGIASTRLNAQLLHAIFGEYAYGEIVTDPYVIPETDKPIIIGAGWRPGWSTDFDAVVYAIETKVPHVINISNINYVYTKDPNKYDDAEKIEDITWQNYRNIIPSGWEAGLHSPFDPIASKKADEAKLSVFILNGKSYEELRNAIENKPFKGTRIHP